LSINWHNAVPIPALCAHPLAAANLDEAHAAIEQWEHYSRKRLDSAQRLSVEHMMAIRADGTWAARTTGRAEPRQNGKGDELEVVEAWDLTQRAAPIVHTAHEIPTAKSAHLRLVAHLEGHRDLRRLVKQARYANGDQSIEMVNGGIVAYRTRTAGGGRGLDDIARLVVDEAQHAQPEQLASSTPILAVNPNPQVNFTGSAGISGRSAHWWMLRKRAMAGGGGDFAWLEHSAEKMRLIDNRVESIRPDATDVANWSIANHAFPDRISPEFLGEQLKILGPDLYSREHLCVWDPPDDEFSSVFGAGRWGACTGERLEDLKPAAFAIGVSYDLSRASVAAAAPDGDRVFGKILAHAPGTGWVVAMAKELQDAHRVDVVVDEHGPGADLIAALELAGVRVKRAKTPDVLDACADLYKRVQDGLVTHEDNPELNTAVAGAVKRMVGDRWAWGHKQSSSDISPLEAFTLACWWAGQWVPDYDLMKSFW